MIGHLNGLRFWRILLLVAGLALAPGSGAQTVSVEMVVSLKDAKALTIRSAPNAEGTVVAFVENGKVVVKKGQEDANGFVLVQLSDGRTGWTKASYLARVPAPPMPVVPDVVNTAPVVQPVAMVVPQEQPVPVAAMPPVIAPAIKAEARPVPAAAPTPVIQKAPATIVPPAVARDEQVVQKLPGKRTEISIVHVVIAGFVGLLIGLIVGGKSGMAYASRAIHDRYEVIG